MQDRDYSAFITEVRESTDLVSLIGESVPLRKAGRRHKGLCPFHEEKTPSFSVDGDKGLFYCFGCQTGGDAFKFLMLRESMEFPEAARTLGERAGLKPPERKGPGSDRRRRVFEANAAALVFFQKSLTHADTGRAAREYLAGRGIGDDTMERFELGFAPDSWERMRTHLNGKNVSDRAAVEAGLLIDRQEDGKRIYARFRNRVIFPIRSLGGEIVAFGGRTLDKTDPAKYINSPESPVYIKGEVVYGLDRAKSAIRERGFVVLVEGYMDLVGLVAAGFPNVVATLGTALTASQGKLLRRTTDRIVINYDADDAGRQATHRALEILLGMDIQVSVIRLEGGQDPDDFVREHGSDAYLTELRRARPAVEFLVDEVAAESDLTRPHARAEAVNRLLPFLARIESPVERTGYLELIAERLRIDTDLVQQELREALKRGKKWVPERVRGPQAARRPATAISLNLAEGRLLGILASSAGAREALRRELEPEDLEGSPAEPILKLLLEQDDSLEPATLTELLPDEESRRLLTRVLVEQEEEGSAEEARSCLQAIRKTRLARERDQVQRQLERSSDSNALEELMARKMELSRRIDALS